MLQCQHGLCERPHVRHGSGIQHVRKVLGLLEGPGPHLPPDMPCGSCAGEGRQGHWVQSVILGHLIQQVTQIVVLNNEPAGGGAVEAVLQVR